VGLCHDLVVPGSILVRSPEHYVASLFLWGVVIDGKFVDQVIGVAWTLRFEIVFYAAMAVALAISQRYRAHIAGLLLLLVTAAAQYVPSGAIAPLEQARNWHPGFYEFLYGMLVFSVWKGLSVHRRVALGAGRSLLMAGGLTLLSIAALAPFAANGILAAPIHHKHLAWGLPALAVFCLWLLPLQRFALTGPPHRVSAFLGSSSFAIYLLHPLALTILTWVEPMRSFWLTQPFFVAVAITFPAATLFGCIGHLLVERPLLAWLRPLARRHSRTRRSSETEAGVT
jgi:exopolysaccharide production protein ExoZ